MFRLANLMLEPLRNRGEIVHVQITHREVCGIGKQAGFSDGRCAMRKSRLLPMRTLVAIEPPPSLYAEALRDEKVKVLCSISSQMRTKTEHPDASTCTIGSSRIDA